MTYPKLNALRSTPAKAAMILALTAGLSAVVVPQSLPAQAKAAPISRGYVDLVQGVSPAVVTIEVEKQAPAMAQASGALPQGAPYEEFFKRFGSPQHRAPQHKAPQPNSPQRGAGSGFVVDSQGLIVTNAHVVEGADKVTVRLKDGRSFSAQVKGLDRATDIAVLSVEAEDLPALRFGASEALQVGEPVVAIGNPFGLGQTVTTGIVSALGRDIKAGPFDDFIQTDAAINRGNSGGPLLNEAGEVIGINTAIYSPSGGSVGLGFAVPSTLAAQVVADLIDDGEVERGYLGVMIAPLSEEVRQVLGLGEADGVMISEVTPETAAAEAGLQKGDVVMTLDGTLVTSPRDLTRRIASSLPGNSHQIEVLRAGEKKTLSFTLGRRQSEDA